MNRYQIGYRPLNLSKADAWKVPYFDLPEFDAKEGTAFKLIRQLNKDFPDKEWRLVEVITTKSTHPVSYPE